MRGREAVNKQLIDSETHSYTAWKRAVLTKADENIRTPLRPQASTKSSMHRKVAVHAMMLGIRDWNAAHTTEGLGGTWVNKHDGLWIPTIFVEYVMQFLRLMQKSPAAVHRLNHSVMFWESNIGPFSLLRHPNHCLRPGWHLWDKVIYKQTNISTDKNNYYELFELYNHQYY